VYYKGEEMKDNKVGRGDKNACQIWVKKQYHLGDVCVKGGHY
jgi:hypothetical protein